MVESNAHGFMFLLVTFAPSVFDCADCLQNFCGVAVVICDVHLQVIGMDVFSRKMKLKKKRSKYMTGKHSKWLRMPKKYWV